MISRQLRTLLGSLSDGLARGERITFHFFSPGKAP